MEEKTTYQYKTIRSTVVLTSIFLNLAFFFSKPFYSLVFICVLGSCVSSKNTVIHPCDIHFLAGDKLLMPEIGQVEYARSYKYFNILQDKLDECGLSIHYIPESEYDLQLAGVKDPMDSKNFRLLNERFNFTHLLIVEITSLRNSKSSFEYYTEYELKQQERLAMARNDLQKTAVLNFKIFSMESMKMIYNLSVETNVNPMIFKDDDNGEREVNLGNTGMATEKSIIKGVKKIKKDCGCSH